MTLLSLAQLHIRARLFCQRLGAINSFVLVMICSGIFTGWWYLSYLQKQANEPFDKARQSLRALETLHDETREPPLPIPEQRLRAFYDNLGEKRYVEQQIKTLFAIAEKSGISLNQAEYKFAYDKSSDIHTYHVTLPVKGQYEAIQTFCKKTLLAVPFASLDDLNFKRDAIDDNSLEAKLRFTFYLADQNAAGASEPSQVASPSGAVAP